MLPLAVELSRLAMDVLLALTVSQKKSQLVLSGRLGNPHTCSWQAELQRGEERAQQLALSDGTGPPPKVGLLHSSLRGLVVPLRSLRLV